MVIALIGMMVSAATFLFAFSTPERRRPEIFVSVLVLHLTATGIYWTLAAQDGYDALFYYSDPLDWADQPFQPGSVAIIFLVQNLKSLFGGSFLAYFLLFQSFGMIGCALLLRTFDEISASLGMEFPARLCFLLLLPGMHLWTVAIGKDAPLFMAVSLSVWASLRLGRRLLWMATAIVVVALIRAPVAVLMIAAIAAALGFDKRLTIGIKAVLAMGSMLGLAMVLSTTQSQLEIVTLDTQGISDFVERNQNLGGKVAGGAEIVGLPYPLKLLSLLFRPFFFDATGILGLLSSLENLVLLSIFAYIAVNVRTLTTLMQSVFHVSYSVVFAATLFASLALVNYNVGLGLRQKTMGLPAVLVILVSIMLFRRFQSARVGNLRVPHFPLHSSA